VLCRFKLIIFFGCSFTLEPSLKFTVLLESMALLFFFPWAKKGIEQSHQ
jgi:hypothetical protein